MINTVRINILDYNANIIQSLWEIPLYALHWSIAPHDEKEFYTASYLGEVAYKMAAHTVVLRENIEKEWLHIVVQRFVIQEQLGQQAQILTIDLVNVPVHLKYWYFPSPIYLIGWRMV